jgi:hypothetical protein
LTKKNGGKRRERLYGTQNFAFAVASAIVIEKQPTRQSTALHAQHRLGGI